jgi:hypothetical protein
MTATVGSAGVANMAVAAYDPGGSPLWLSQITTTTAEGKFQDFRVVPTEFDTVLVACKFVSDGAGANPISINIYNGDTTLAPGAFAGTLHANWQSDRNNNQIVFHGVLVVGFNATTGAVTGWTALNDDTASVAFCQMQISGLNLDGSGGAVVYGRQQVNYSGGADDWTGAVYSNGVEVDNPFYDSSVIQALWGLTHTGTWHANVNAYGAYRSGSFDFDASLTNASGSIFRNGLTGRLAGNATKFVITTHATILDASAQIQLNGRDGTPQLSGTGKMYRGGLVAKYDRSTLDVDWIHGLQCSVFPHARQSGPGTVLSDGSVLTGFYQNNSNTGSLAHFITQEGGANVNFNKDDPEPVFIKYTSAGAYSWHKILATVTTPGSGSLNILRSMLVDEDNDRVYIVAQIRNGGSATFTYGNGETNQYAITDVPVNPYYTFVVSLHELSTGDFLWMTEVRENNVSGSGAMVARLALSQDGTELHAYGRYTANTSFVGSGATFGHNAGVGRHAPGTPIALTFGSDTGNYTGRYVMNATTLSPIRFDQFGPVGVNATNKINWQATQGVDGV